MLICGLAILSGSTGKTTMPSKKYAIPSNLCSCLNMFSCKAN